MIYQGFSSDDGRIAAPKFLRKAERKLKSAQRRVSRRKKGSNRRKKAIKKYRVVNKTRSSTWIVIIRKSYEYSRFY